jgi:hypothetical protein
MDTNVDIRSRYPIAESGGTLVHRTSLGVSVAIVAVLVTQVIANALRLNVGAPATMSPFAAGPLIGSTIVAGIGAAMLYAVVITLTDRPVRNFVAVAATVFAFMLLPVILITPSMGVTPTGQGLLILHHVLVAVPVSVFILGIVEG